MIRNQSRNICKYLYQVMLIQGKVFKARMGTELHNFMLIYIQLTCVLNYYFVYIKCIASFDKKKVLEQIYDSVVSKLEHWQIYSILRQNTILLFCTHLQNQTQNLSTGKFVAKSIKTEYNLALLYLPSKSNSRQPFQ